MSKNIEKKYTVKRYVLEEYEITASNKDEAKEKAITAYDPGKITVLKETVTLAKEQR